MEAHGTFRSSILTGHSSKRRTRKKWPKGGEEKRGTKLADEQQRCRGKIHLLGRGAERGGKKASALGIILGTSLLGEEGHGEVSNVRKGIDL